MFSNSLLTTWEWWPKWKWEFFGLVFSVDLFSSFTQFFSVLFLNFSRLRPYHGSKIHGNLLDLCWITKLLFTCVVFGEIKDVNRTLINSFNSSTFCELIACVIFKDHKTCCFFHAYNIYTRLQSIWIKIKETQHSDNISQV